MPKEQPTVGRPKKGDPLVASLLREHIEAQGIPHHQVATAAGLTQPSLTRILTGETDTPLSTLLRVLGALGLSLRWLHDRGVRPPE